MRRKHAYENARGQPLRAYQCRSCHGWHLTKNLKRDERTSLAEALLALDTTKEQP